MTEHNYVVAVDLGATHLRTAIIDRNGSVIKKNIAKTQKELDHPEVTLQQIISEIKKIAKEFSWNDIIGIGVSGASPVDMEKGAFVVLPNFPIDELIVREPLEEIFSCDIVIQNDTTAAVWGEKVFGKGIGYNNVVYVTISTGIGAGVISDGRPLRGRDCNAGEVGHFYVHSNYRLPCDCERVVGHWESIASGKNIPRFFGIWCEQNDVHVKQICNGPCTSKGIFKEAETNSNVRDFIDVLGSINGRAVSNIIIAYNPEIIIFGGAVVINNREIFLNSMINTIDHFLMPLPEIVVTDFGDEVSLIGVAASIFNKVPNC